MRKLFLFVFLLFFLWGGFLPSYAEALEPDTPPFTKIEQLNPDLQCRDVLQIATQYGSDFVPVPDGLVTLSGTANSTWLRIPIDELRQHIKNDFGNDAYDGSVLFLGSHSILNADCFMPKGDEKFVRYTHGIETLATKGSIYYRHPVFLLQNYLDKGYVYLNLQSRFPLKFHVYLLCKSVYLNFFFKSAIIHVTFFGLLFALIFTFAFFYQLTKDNLCLYSILEQIGTFFFLATINGYLQYFWGLSVQAVVLMGWASCCTINIAHTFFCRFMTKAPQPGSRLRKSNASLLLAQALLSCALLCLIFFKLDVWAFRIIILTFLLSVWSDVTVVMHKIGQERSLSGIGFFILSRILYLCALTGTILNTVLPTLFPKTDFFAMICFPLSTLVLSLILTQEIRSRFKNYESLEEEKSHFQELSQVDRMTGVSNKTHMMRLLAENITTAKELGKPLSFIMMDIDHFKKYNDTWGHQEGDHALQFVAQIIRQNLRDSDLAARYGGEEFSVILSGASLPSAVLVAERIRKACEMQSQLLKSGKTLTTSLGISTLQPDDTPDTLIKRADEALYRAKNNGRNRTEVEEIVRIQKNSYSLPE